MKTPERLVERDYNELWRRNHSLIFRLMLNKLFNRIQTKTVTEKKKLKNLLFDLIYIFPEISYNSNMYI